MWQVCCIDGFNFIIVPRKYLAAPKLAPECTTRYFCDSIQARLSPRRHCISLRSPLGVLCSFMANFVDQLRAGCHDKRQSQQLFPVMCLASSLDVLAETQFSKSRPQELCTPALYLFAWLKSGDDFGTFQYVYIQLTQLSIKINRHFLGRIKNCFSNNNLVLNKMSALNEKNYAIV